jgi:hypothetical protein
MSDLKRGIIRLRPSIAQSMARISKVLLGPTPAATAFAIGILVDCLQMFRRQVFGRDLVRPIGIKSVLDP